MDSRKSVHNLTEANFRVSQVLYILWALIIQRYIASSSQAWFYCKTKALDYCIRSLVRYTIFAAFLLDHTDFLQCQLKSISNAGCPTVWIGCMACCCSSQHVSLFMVFLQPHLVFFHPKNSVKSSGSKAHFGNALYARHKVRVLRWVCIVRVNAKLHIPPSFMADQSWKTTYHNFKMPSRSCKAGENIPQKWIAV